jgi:hypothetical protein
MAPASSAPSSRAWSATRLADRGRPGPFGARPATGFLGYRLREPGACAFAVVFQQSSQVADAFLRLRPDFLHMFRDAGKIFQRRHFACRRRAPFRRLDVEIPAQFLRGCREFVLQAAAAIDAEQLQPVVDGVPRVGFGVFDQGLRRSLLEPHGQHDFRQLQSRFDVDLVLDRCSRPWLGPAGGTQGLQLCVFARHRFRVGLFQRKVDNHGFVGRERRSRCGR